MLTLTTLPLWLSALLIVALPTAIAMVGPFIVRRFVRFERLHTNNEVAGFKFATVGVLYAVLLAFAIIVVWEKFNDSENVVAKEAGAAATIYRLSDGLSAERRTALRGVMNAYLSAAIGKDWPAMERGTLDPGVTSALSDIYVTLLNARAGAGPDTVLMTEILRQLDEISAARRARFVTADGNIPDIFWFVLFGGAIVTVGFTFFFGTQNLRAQALMTGALAALVFSALLTVIVIDHPFAGSVKVEPEALSTCWKISAACRGGNRRPYRRHSVGRSPGEPPCHCHRRACPPHCHGRACPGHLA